LWVSETGLKFLGYLVYLILTMTINK